MATTSKATCPPIGGDGPCGTLPHGFSRLRYFFGKRLGVADFVDEQRYHAGKHRFHNQHLHGAGVVCGLAASVFDGTVLRIDRGAALDHCGREIIVGADQCVDIDAWYRQQIEADPAVFDGALDPAGNLRLCVTLAYSECKTGPEPAPRDPCSCAEGGCDYGRTLESFGLSLELEAEARANETDSLFPSAPDIAAAIQAGGGIEGIEAALGSAVMASCPEPVENNTLLVACFTAVLSAAKDAVDSIESLEATPFLLSTAALQEIVISTLAASASPALGGPSIGAPELLPDGAATYLLNLPLDSGIESSSFDATAFALHLFDPAAGWKPIPAAELTLSYVEVPSPLFELSIDNSAGFLVNTGRYRLVVDSNHATPMVDSALRPISPARFSTSFEIADNAGTLELAPIPA